MPHSHGKLYELQHSLLINDLSLLAKLNVGSYQR